MVERTIPYGLPDRLTAGTVVVAEGFAAVDEGGVGAVAQDDWLWSMRTDSSTGSRLGRDGALPTTVEIQHLQADIVRGDAPASVAIGVTFSRTFSCCYLLTFFVFGNISWNENPDLCRLSIASFVPRMIPRTSG